MSAGEMLGQMGKKNPADEQLERKNILKGGHL